MASDFALRSHPKWRNNRILSNAGKEWKMTWVFAVLWNALIWFAIVKGHQGILDAIEENPVFYVFVLFPVVGVVLVYQGISQTLAWFKFGETPMRLDPFPGQTGGVVAGYLSLPVSVQASKNTQVSLSCVHEYWKKSRGKSEQQRDILWQDDRVASSSRSANGSRIRFEFNPPANLPQSQPEGKDKYLWEVHVHLSLPGQDYDRVFVIPVAESNEEKLQVFAKQPEAKPSFLQSGQDVTENTKIPKINKSEKGVSFHYPAFRNKGLGFGLIIASLLIDAFLWFMYQEMTDFLPTFGLLMFGMIALVIMVLTLFGLFLLFNSLSVAVNTQTVNVKNCILGFSFGGEVPVDSIADIKLHKSGSSSNGRSSRVWYSLQLVQKNGMETTVGDSLEGYSYAESIRHKMIAQFGEQWSPVEICSGTPVSKINKIRKISQPVGRLVSFLMFAALIYDFRQFFLT